MTSKAAQTLFNFEVAGKLGLDSSSPDVAVVLYLSSALALEDGNKIYAFFKCGKGKIIISSIFSNISYIRSLHQVRCELEFQ